MQSDYTKDIKILEGGERGNMGLILLMVNVLYILVDCTSKFTLVKLNKIFIIFKNIYIFLNCIHIYMSCADGEKYILSVPWNSSGTSDHCSSSLFPT